MDDTPEEDPQPSELDMLATIWSETLLKLVVAARVDDPTLQPAALAATLIANMADTLGELIEPASMKQGLLIAFERLHEKPMNFRDLKAARDALNVIASRRAKHTGQSRLITLN